ncbi:MAG: PhoH family protein [Atopobiaceae bacterium]|nr:PhoH family protein [Atopobiaceae bacterium]
MEPTQVRITIPESVDSARVMGPADAYLRRIEESFDVMLSVRGNRVSMVGSSEAVEGATSAFSHLIRMIEAGDTPTLADVDLVIAGVSNGTRELSSSPSDEVLLTYRGRSVRARTEGQARYVAAMRRSEVTFGIGPAGTGKTYLAMAMAVSALRRHEVARIVLTRPVVEAGESLGYLPGTLQEKIDPYVRPLYDALFDMMDMERASVLLERGVIEVAPLAYMRGRTLNDSFVILDEAQNTTPEQMKMFLTRLGMSSRFVVTGDVTQRDLRGPSGLDVARKTLDGIEGISFCDLGKADIVRHSLVARIVEAYARHEGRRGEDPA